MSWRACLELHYSLESARTVARYRHDGPLRVLRSLYPEGDTVCHNVLLIRQALFVNLARAEVSKPLDGLKLNGIGTLQ